MLHTIDRPSLAAVGTARRAGVAALAALALVAGGAGTAPVQG
jgi:hypothetical protein